MGRRILLSLVALAFLPQPSRALDLIWSNGTKNLTVTAASVCTLLVKPTGDEPLLPGRWRLLYVGSAEVDSPLVFVNQAGPPDAAPTCSVAGPVTEVERLSRQT